MENQCFFIQITSTSPLWSYLISYILFLKMNRVQLHNQKSLNNPRYNHYSKQIYRMKDQNIENAYVQNTYQQCPHCSQTTQSLMGQRYCSSCKETPLMLFQQIRNVHQNYRPNSESIKLSGLAKIEEHVKNLMKRLNLMETQSTINEIVQQVACLHQYRGRTLKGYYEQCAAVIYINFKQQHKMISRQFCTKIKASVKKFNQMYIKYTQMQKQVQNKRQNKKIDQIQGKYQNQLMDEYLSSSQNIFYQNSSNISQIKQFQDPSCSIMFGEYRSDMDGFSNMQKLEEEAVTQNCGKSDKNSESEQFLRIPERSKIQCMIQQLYDSLFQSPYLRDLKQTIALNLTQKMLYINNIYKKKHPKTLQIYNDYQQTLYLLFGIIKTFGYKISLKSYQSAILRKFDLCLNLKKLGIVHKQIEIILKRRDQFSNKII